MSIANYITLLRLIAIPGIAYYYLQGRYEWALILLIFAGFSDLLDGFLARSLGQRTKLGAILDPFADKLLMFICFICLAYTHQVPFWLAALVIGRDIYIVLGVWFLKWRCKKLYIRPTYLSKLNTFFQLGFLFFMFLNFYIQQFSPLFLKSWAVFLTTSQQVALWMVVFMAFASAMHYSMVALAIFQEDRKNRKTYP